jgi:hypothetical protein
LEEQEAEELVVFLLTLVVVAEVEEVQDIIAH